MKTNSDIEHYIRLQRTGYANADTARCYEKDIQIDYDSMKAYLPDTCSRIMDIGSGMAGIDLLLYNHYKGVPELHLLDYSKTDDAVYYGYRQRGSVYNSLELSAQFLKMNGVDKAKIGTHNAENGFYNKPYDIIISLISCGFHYPVSTYLKNIITSNPKIVILDIRKHSNQIPELKKHFSSVEIIAEYSKCERVLMK